MPEQIDDLPQRLSDGLDRRVDDFDDAWNTGAAPDLKQFLPKVFRGKEGPVRAEWRLFVAELLMVDLEYRLRQPTKETPARIEDYYALIPWLPSDEAVLLHVIPAEYMARCQHSGETGIEEYTQRFPHLGDALARRLEEAEAELAREQSVSNGIIAGTDSFSGIQIIETIPTGSAGDTSIEPPRETPRQFGDYELHREIERGGMGIVYKATQKSLKRTVALKVILSGGFAQSEDVKRFYAEAEAGGKLDHPNIVPVHEVGRVGANHFFSMKYVDGPNLWQEVKNKSLKPERAARFIRDVAGAIQYAHDRNIIHRDIKPSNILLENGETPRVTDFGLARRMDVKSGVTVAGNPLGTAQYMPPEQALGDIDKMDARSDVYSLGATLYCLLTGRPPFQGADLGQTLQMVKEQDPLPPRRLNPAIPRDLENICLKCLNKSPESRYQTAADLRDDLNRFLSGKPTVARRVSTTERVVRFCRRQPWTASLMVTAVGLFLALLTGGVVWSLKNVDDLAMAEGKNLDLEFANTGLIRAKNDAEANAAEATRQRLDAEENLRLAEFIIYVSTLQRTRELWAEGRADEARSEFRRVRSLKHWDALRGWEWEHINGLLQEERLVIDAHDQMILSVKWSADGKWFASASLDRKVKIWSGETGRFHWMPNGNGDVAREDLVLEVGFVGDGRQLLTLSDDGTAELWDVEQKLRISGFATGLEQVKLAAIADDGGRFACCDDMGTVQVYDTQTRHPVAEWPPADMSVSAMAFDSPAQRLALADETTGQIVIRPLSADGEVVLPRAGDAIRTMAWSADGTSLAVAGDSGFLEVWDPQTGAQRAEWNTGGGQTYCVAFGSDSEQLLTGTEDDILRMWSIRDQQVIDVFRGHADDVLGVRPQPAGDSILSAGAEGTLRLWRSDRDEMELTGLTNGGAVLPAPERDGLRYQAGNSLMQVSFELNAEPRVVAMPVTSDVRTVVSVAEPAGGFLISTGGAGVLCDQQGTEVRRFTILPGEIERMCASPSGSRVAATDGDNRISMTDVASGKSLWQDTFPAAAEALCFTSEGRELLVVDAEGRAQLLQAESGEPLESCLMPHWAAAVDCCQLTSIAAVGGRDGAVHLYVLPKLTEKLVLQGHQGAVTAVAFSPDGTRLAAGDTDRTIHIWMPDVLDWAPEQVVPMLTLKGHEHQIEHVFWTDNGQTLISVDRGGTAIRWQTPMS